MTRLSRLSDCVVFFDFDNTITPFDVLDDIIKRFSINNEWVALERLWKAGKIGSEECLKGQLQSIRVTKQRLSSHLSKIKLSPYFNKLIAFLKRKRIKAVILSDDFSFIINSILKANRIKKTKVYSNRIRFYKERLIPSFPYTDRLCKRCAHCKKKQLKKSNLTDKIIIYVGDGISDLCPAREADIVFAKGELLKYFRKKKKICVSYKDHKDIYDYLRRLDR